MRGWVGIGGGVFLVEIVLPRASLWVRHAEQDIVCQAAVVSTDKRVGLTRVVVVTRIVPEHLRISFRAPTHLRPSHARPIRQIKWQRITCGMVEFGVAMCGDNWYRVEWAG